MKDLESILQNFNRNRIVSASDFEKKMEKFQHLFGEPINELKVVLDSAQPEQVHKEWWARLIRDWVEDESMPLFIRKFNDKFPRGSEVIHSSGRVLIPCDNGPAHWSFSMCYNDNYIGLPQIKEFLSNDLIPVAFAIKGTEKQSKYRQTKHLIDTPNKKGWKIAHVAPVGLKTRTSLVDIPIETLEEHFRKFMDPMNMFVVPIELSGLAEIPEVIEAFKTEPIGGTIEPTHIKSH